MNVRTDVAEQFPVANRQVRGLHKRDAQLFGQEGVLEPGRVVPAGGQQRHRRFVAGPRRRRGTQGLQQHRRHLVHVAELGGPLKLGQVLGEQPPVRDRIGGARGDAQVVFEHHPVAGAVANQVGAADVGADRVARQPARRTESGCTVQRVHPDDAVGEDGLLGVDVTQEGVERLGPLTQTGGEFCPLVSGDQPRHQVEREHLGAVLAADPERDALGALVLLDVALPGPQHRDPEVGDGVQDLFVGGPWPPVGSTASS